MPSAEALKSALDIAAPFELYLDDVHDWIESVWKDPTDVDFGSYGLDQCLDLVETALAAGGGLSKPDGGIYLQPPAEKDGLWTTIIRYDTAEHLEAWMEAPAREELLKESQAFIEREQLMRLATSFPGWVPIDAMTGKGPPNWKTALLVILGLFPIVMLEMRFLSPILAVGLACLAGYLHR